LDKEHSIMAEQRVITPSNLGNEFDLGVQEAGKIHVKLGSGLTRDLATGEISFDAGVLPADVSVQGLSWNPATGELTLTETDGTPHVVNLNSLAADKFLAGSSYNPATSELTMTMTDGSSYVISLADLAPVAATGGLQGTGVTGDELRPDFDNLPLAGVGDQSNNDLFVMSTVLAPDGQRVSASNAAQLIYDEFVGADLVQVSTGVGISGTGQAADPLVFAADELPLLGGAFDVNAPTNYVVMSTSGFPNGAGQLHCR
jgi:hypothetical protein